jgi:hypothetical protein
MIETIDPRTGTNPITGDAIVPVDQPPTNPINGKEYTITARDDLQYACIFPLPTPRDCTDPLIVSCDCKDPNNNNPLCEEKDPAMPGNRTLQTKAKAYPGLRELSVLKALGTQGITASVCPAQLTDQAKPDFGYRPAIGAIIDRLKEALRGQCLPRTLTPDAENQVPCLILEGKRVEGDQAAIDACNKCEAEGRQPVSEDHQPAVAGAKETDNYKVAKWNCFCEIKQTTGDDLTACQNDEADPPQNPSTGAQVDGWCYVDATTTPQIGDPKIVADCPETEKRIIRFVGKGAAAPGGTLFITCSGE